MHVEELMSLNPFCVQPDTSALSALDLMVDEGIHHLPVVDSDRAVVGVISISDLAAALPSEVSRPRRGDESNGHEMCQARVGDVMSYSPLTIRSTSLALEAARCMVQNAIGCLPVVDEQGQLEGIVSESDILRAYAAEGAGREAHGAPEAASDDVRRVETLREEAERLNRSLSTRDPASSKLAVARLRSLEEAIARAESGEILSCTRCRGTISWNRLRALPGTTICSRCARDMEW